MAGWNGEVRPAEAGDIEQVACLAAELAQSFAFCRESFLASYPVLLADHGARLLLAAHGQEVLGYLLGFRSSAAIDTESASSAERSGSW
jgi:hypothetical protein